MYPAQNPYDTAYMFLLERFQMYLQQEKSSWNLYYRSQRGPNRKTFFW